MTTRTPLIVNSSGRQAQIASGDVLDPTTTTDVPVRQTVLSSSVDSNGLPNFITAGSGLAVNIAATTTPIIIAFAAGFGANGSTDYVGQITADTSITGLTASTTNYLYADRNTSTGAITLGATTTAPTYGYSAASTTNGQHSYRIPDGKMYLGNGSTAPAVQRVFLGEAVTSSSAVTSVVNYALQGRYMSTETAVTGNNTYTFSHNIGVPMDQCTATLTTRADSSSSWRPWLPYFSNSTSSYGMQINGSTTNNSCKTYASTNPMTNDANTGFVTSGNVKLRVLRNF